jgi:hypothetical protein
LRQPNETGKLRAGQELILSDNRAVEYDFAGDGDPQRKLALGLGRVEPLHTAFDDEAADYVVEFRPNDRNVGDRRVENPGLAAGQPKAAGNALGPSRHSRRI